MAKEELEKEATEFEENYTVYEVAKRKDGSDYAKKVCKVTVKEAYLAGAEPREKRIADLERKLEQTEKDLTDYQFNYPKILDLEKENDVLKEALAEQKQYNAFKCEDNKKSIDNLKQENAELKAQLQKKINTTTVSDYPYSALKLEEAKGIIKQLLLLPYANNEEVYSDVTSTLDKAEQFLKEE